MGLFSSSVVEWNENYNDNVIFYKWKKNDIKRGSRLVLRPGQDAIFLHNGSIEGIFTDDGVYDIESDIVPSLATLASFRFGLAASLRVEVLFVNTRVLSAKWGTRNAIMVQTPKVKAGIPVRAFGTFSFKINDYLTLIEDIAGVRDIYTVNDLRERIIANIDRLLMKWISTSGQDVYNLQASAYDIGSGMLLDMNNELMNTGLVFVDFNIQSFSYPEEVMRQKNIEAGRALNSPKFCPNCGRPVSGTKFCMMCGAKIG